MLMVKLFPYFFMSKFLMSYLGLLTLKVSMSSNIFFNISYLIIFFSTLFNFSELGSEIFELVFKKFLGLYMILEFFSIFLFSYMFKSLFFLVHSSLNLLISFILILVGVSYKFLFSSVMKLLSNSYNNNNNNSNISHQINNMHKNFSSMNSNSNGDEDNEEEDLNFKSGGLKIIKKDSPVKCGYFKVGYGHFSFEDSNSDFLKNIKISEYHPDKTSNQFCKVSDTSSYSPEIFVEYFILYIALKTSDSFNKFDTSLVEPNWSSKVSEHKNIMNYTECLLNALMSKEGEALKSYSKFLSSTGLLGGETPAVWVEKTLSETPKFMKDKKNVLLSFVLITVLMNILGFNEDFLSGGCPNPLLSFDKYIKHLLLLVIMEAAAFNGSNSFLTGGKNLDYTKYIMGLSQVFDEGEKELQLLDLFPKIHNSMSGGKWYSSKCMYVKFGVESFHIKSKNYISSYMSEYSK